MSITKKSDTSMTVIYHAKHVSDYYCSTVEIQDIEVS